MALVLGTNCGFVISAPSSNPGGLPDVMDTRSWVGKDTSPSTAGKITEIGWWCDNATEEANFEVGLYAADGATVPGEAGTRLFVSATNAKGTTSGWKSVTVDWSISPSTDYWLGVQLDDTATQTNIDVATSGGSGYDNKTSQTTLTNPYGGGAFLSTRMVAIYAVWGVGDPTYTLTADAGSLALTGQTTVLSFDRVMSLAQGALTLTGQNLLFARTYALLAEFGSYVLTGISALLNFSGWTDQNKNSSTFANESKNSSTFSNESKSSSSWNNQSKS